MSSAAQQMLLAAGASPAVLSFLQSTNYSSDASSTVTFAAINLGAAAANRQIFVAVEWYNGGSPPASNNATVASATIGGVAATIHAQTPPPSANAGTGAALISASVPTGTSGDIVVIFSGGSGFWRPRINTYRVTGLQSAIPVHSPIVRSVTSSATQNWTENVKSGGIILVTGMSYGNATSRTVSGVTQDYNFSPVSSYCYYGGSSEISVSNSAFPLSVSSDGSAASFAVISAVFR